MDRIILIGAGGHAKSCIDVIEKTNKFKIIGLIDNKETNHIFNYPILGNDAKLINYTKKEYSALITIGQIKIYEVRLKMFNNVFDLGFNMPVIVSPLAYVSKYSKINFGTIIMHKAIVNANCYIGKNCIINSNSLIEHDCEIADNCHISTGAIINGGVKIGQNTFIGSGSIIKHGIEISGNSFIKAGSFIS